MPAVRAAAAYRARLSPAFVQHSKRLDEKPRPDGLIFGSPDTVAEQLSVFRDTGIGGVILRFRLGPMTHEITARSMKLFAEDLGGPDRISLNIFAPLSGALVLKPCEMPLDKVTAFVLGVLPQ